MISREQASRILAEKIFGLDVREGLWPFWPKPRLVHYPEGRGKRIEIIPDYFTDPIASDALLDKLVQEWECTLSHPVNGAWWATLDGAHQFYQEHDTFKYVAIAACALRSVGVTEEVEHDHQ